MGEPKQPRAPFSLLGNRLKQLRQGRKESVAEVSGAVEIDIEELEKIERGLKLPAEEILLLLISYFGISEREGLKLWEMAGYGNEMPGSLASAGESRSDDKQPPSVVILAADLRTIYTDGVNINVNPSGVTMNFLQTTDPNSAMPIARVGMSIVQAQNVLNTLQQALLEARYGSDRKALPPSTQ